MGDYTTGEGYVNTKPQTYHINLFYYDYGDEIFICYGFQIIPSGTKSKHWKSECVWGN